MTPTGDQKVTYRFDRGGGSMKPEIKTGDCLEVLRTLPDSSCDSLVTDPPAGISFMGKAWDDDKGGRRQWIAWMSEVMSECMRVMKPGAHGLVWAIPRTSHWTATALEDAGFEIRDVVTHLFGSGFPKSLDISKAMDKAAGAEREVIGKVVYRENDSAHHGEFGNLAPTEDGKMKRQWDVTAPSTDLAKEWQGWGTALKPASEHWILVRKPISEKTVAKNVEKWGVGGINIDGCRIENSGKSTARITNAAIRGGNLVSGRTEQGPMGGGHDGGRFPANLVLSCVCEEDQHDAFCPVHVLDEQSGMLSPGHYANKSLGFGKREYKGRGEKTEKGGASRFFYVAKPSKRERNAGCEGLPLRQGGGMQGSADKTLKTGSGNERDCMNNNHHPTVKPIKLMRYLIRMITPPNGLVLDPFTGSGTTGVAAVSEGFKFIGIEQNAEYTQIAEKRIYHAFPEFKKDVQT